MITCNFENNRKASLRHVTVDAIIIKDNKILLVKRAADLILEGNKYALPGGFLDRNETASQGVVREVLEETGFKSKVISIFRINDNPNRKGEDRQNVDFVFLVEPLEKISQPNHEVQEAYWFNLDNLHPANQFAFDHYENIKLYLKHRKQPFTLPIFQLP